MEYMLYWPFFSSIELIASAFSVCWKCSKWTQNEFRLNDKIAKLLALLLFIQSLTLPPPPPSLSTHSFSLSLSLRLYRSLSPSPDLCVTNFGRNTDWIGVYACSFIGCICDTVWFAGKLVIRECDDGEKGEDGAPTKLCGWEEDIPFHQQQSKRIQLF